MATSVEEDYRNYQKVNVAVPLTIKAMAPFCVDVMESFHNSLKKSIGSSKCNAGCTKEDIKKENFTCGSNVCDKWLAAIEAQATGEYSVDNTTVALWPVDPWSVAQYYMGPGHETNTNQFQTNPSGMLQLVINCKQFHALINIDKVKEVMKVVNSLVHATDYKFAAAEMETHMQCLVDLLQEPALQRYTDTQDVITKIKMEELYIGDDGKQEQQNTDIAQIKELEGKWVSRSSRWKEKLQKLLTLCGEHPDELVRGIRGQICMCTKEDYLVAKGSSGTVVYLGFTTTDGREVAVKRLVKHPAKRLNKRVDKEVKALIGLSHHPNIVEYMMPVIHDMNFSYIVLELCDYSLETWLSRKEVKDLTEEDWRMQSVHLIGDLLRGLEHIHANDMLHRDLKPQNLFVVQLTGGSQCLKIADFGLTRSLENGASTVHTAVDGTTHWLPKEVIVQMNESTTSDESSDTERKIKYKQSGDIQVCGMLCYYIVTQGGHPYRPLDDELHTRVKNGKPDLSPVKHDFEACDLISSMLADDPKARPSAEQLRRHLYFWSDRDRYEFIVGVAKEDEVHNSHKEPHKSSEFVGKLEDTKISVSEDKNDWGSLSIIEDLKAAAGKKLKFLYSTDSTKSVCKLIRAMRNIQEHYVEQREKVKEELGVKDEAGVHTFCYSKAFSYFHTNFQRLVWETYRVVKEDKSEKKKKLLSDFPRAGDNTKMCAYYRTTSGPTTTTSGPTTTTPGQTTTTSCPTTMSGQATTASGPTTTTSGQATTASGPVTITSGQVTTVSGPTTTTSEPKVQCGQEDESRVWKGSRFWNFEVGQEGATLRVKNVSLTIPPGALEEELTITMAMSSNEKDRPKLTHNQLLVGPVVHCLWHGLKFKRQIKLSFDYDPEEVQASSKMLVLYSETGLNEPSCWKEHEPPAECSEDESTKTCYIITNHFSLYCLVSEVEDATESADETSTNTESADETSTNTESADEASAHTDSAEETEGDVTVTTPENEIATEHPTFAWTKRSDTWNSKLAMLQNKSTDELVSGLKTKVCIEQPFCIGSGTSGTQVYVGFYNRGTKNKLGEEVAVKRVPTAAVRAHEERSNEGDMLLHFNPKLNNIAFFNFVECDDSYTCFELCDFTLDVWITKKKGESNWSSLARDLVKQLITTLDYLRRNKVLHCDLTPENILVNEDGMLKLIDFGISQRCESDQGISINASTGTPQWKAKEVLQPGGHYNTASEIYVAGMVAFYVMSGGTHPFHAASEEDVENQTGNPDWSAVQDRLALDMVKPMLAAKPVDRPSAPSLLRHPYLWSDSDRYKFIATVADEEEVEKCREEPHKSSDFVKELEKTRIRVFPNKTDWENLSIVALYRAEKKFENMCTTEHTNQVCTLIRRMRNIQHHHAKNDLPPGVIDELGGYPFSDSKAFSYFNTNFPDLLLETYKVVKKLKMDLLSGFLRDKEEKQTDALPSTSDALPSTSDALPSTSDALPSTSDALPSTSDALPSTSDALPSTSDAPLPTSDASTSDAPSSTSAGAPLSTSDAPPSMSDVLPSKSHERLPTSKGAVAKKSGAQSQGHQKPSGAQKRHKKKRK